MKSVSSFFGLRHRVLALLAVITLSLASLPSYAQFGASLSGTVADSSGALIPGATVTLTNTATQQAKTLTTDASGIYRFSELAPGSYTLSASAANFSAATVSNLSVVAESPRNVDVVLQAGKTSETVTVNADTVALQTSDANIAATIDGEAVQRLPVVGGNPYELLRTAPGIIGDAARAGNGNAIFLPNGAGPGGSSRGIFQTENQTQISANGQRVSDNTYEIDGVTVDSLSHGGAAVVTPNQEAIGQITAVSTSYDAGDGRNSGAHIKVVTKSGTNQLHGSLFFLYDEPGLNAFARYGGPGGQLPVRASTKQRTYDASIGGPLLKDKLFGFASFAGFGLAGNSVASQFIETPQYDAAVIAQRAGGISARIIAAPGNTPRVQNLLPINCSLYNNGTAPCAVVGTGIDVGSLTPGGTTQLGQYVAATAGNGLDGVPDIEYAQVSIPNHSRGRQFNGRVDYYLTQNDQFAGSFYATKLDNYGTSGSNGSRPNQDVPFKPLNTAGTFIYIHTFSPSWLNEFRANGTRFADNGISDGAGLVNYGIPFINIQGVGVSNNIQYGLNGGNASSPAIFAQNTFEVRDQVTHTFGSHSLRLGFEIRFEQDNDNLSGLVRPLYAVQGLWNFANDAPIFEQVNASTITGGAPNTQLYLRSKNIAGYAQHDWKVTPNFTFNTGVRYEIYTPISNKNSNIGHPVLGPAGSELSGMKLVAQKAFYNTDYAHFAPKVGFAWTPQRFNGKAVVRGGFAVAYNHLDTALFQDQSFDNAPGSANFGLCCATTNANAPGTNIVYALGTNNNPNSFPVNKGLAVGVNANGFPSNGSQVELYGTAGTIRNPVSYLYSLDTQFQLPGQVIASLGYAGSLGRHYARLVNQNFLYNNTNSPVFQAFFAQTDSNQDYNSLNARLARTLRHGLQIEGNYTYSKSLDQVSNGDSPNANANQTNPADNRTEYGPSDYDARHRVTVSALYSTPKVHTHNAILSAVANGWQANTIVTAHTGFPYTPVTYNLQANIVTNAAVVGPTRPLGILASGGPIGTSCSNDAFKTGSNFPNRGTGGTGGGAAYFNITAPVLPPGQNYIYKPGIGRNSFRGPCYRDVDVSVAKQLEFHTYGEQHAVLRFQANAFNVFNLLQLSPITNGNAGGGANIGDQNFGKATNVDAGRVIELSMRLNF